MSQSWISEAWNKGSWWKGSHSSHQMYVSWRETRASSCVLSLFSFSMYHNVSLVSNGIQSRVSVNDSSHPFLYVANACNSPLVPTTKWLHLCRLIFENNGIVLSKTCNSSQSLQISMDAGSSSPLITESCNDKSLSLGIVAIVSWRRCYNWQRCKQNGITYNRSSSPWTGSSSSTFTSQYSLSRRKRKHNEVLHSTLQEVVLYVYNLDCLFKSGRDKLRLKSSWFI